MMPVDEKGRILLFDSIACLRANFCGSCRRGRLILEKNHCRPHAAKLVEETDTAPRNGPSSRSFIPAPVLEREDDNIPGDWA